MLSAVKWYFELKNLSLRNAMSIRCPLQPGKQKDLRQYYSQYFSGLLSATELLLESEYEHRAAFKSSLEEALSFGGDFDGTRSYAYLRELRNSVIHRGLDLCSGAHIQEDFPVYVAPSPVTNRSGTASYLAFGRYLIEVIQKCETVVGKVFLNHFQQFGLLSVRLSDADMSQEIRQFIENSSIIPENIKAPAIEAVLGMNHEELHQQSVALLLQELNEDVLAEYFA